MKKNLLLLLLSLLNISLTYAQKGLESPRSSRREEYERFLGQIVSTNGSSVTPTFMLDLASNPEIKLSLPLNRYFKINTGRNLFFVDGKLSSKSNYTPILSKGKWLPDTDLNLNYTFLICRGIYFYKNEIGANNIDSMGISQASSIRFLWLNTKAGYNYSEYSFFNKDEMININNRITYANYHSFFAKAMLNGYWYPSKNNASWLTLYANVGYEYRMNDNNYSLMKVVDFKNSIIYNDSLNNVLEIVGENGKAREGKFVRGQAHSIPFNLSFLFSSNDTKFYVGLNVYGINKTIIEYGSRNIINTTDIGLSINLPIQKQDAKGTKTVTNFTLKADYLDIQNKLNSSLTPKERLRFGFTIGVPLIPTHKKVKKDL